MYSRKTVAEIIQLLSQIPPNTEVFFTWEGTEHQLYTEGIDYYPMENKIVFDVEHDWKDAK